MYEATSEGKSSVIVYLISPEGLMLSGGVTPEIGRMSSTINLAKSISHHETHGTWNITFSCTGDPVELKVFCVKGFL